MNPKILEEKTIKPVDRDLVRDLLPLTRKADSHKGDYGRVLLIAGSKSMMGAAVLCARGAFRSGAGLVSVCCPEDCFPVVQAAIPECTCVSREELMDRIQRGGAEEFLSRYDSIAVGPGLGRKPENKELLEALIKSYEGPLVLDADGLNSMADYNIGIPEGRGKVIITPHIGEAARLLHCSTEYFKDNREEAVKKLARVYNCTAVLKGSGTLVCSQDQRLYVNTSGNPGMATGGSGDVLTGASVSLAAQLFKKWGGEKTAEELTLSAALSAVYLHGLSGDIASEKYGEAGLMASDIADCLALAIKSLKE